MRREGRNYEALCPWHDDTRPSLQVNPERQSFKCWVCDIGGDIFSFVMKMEGVEFPEALAMLAERAGIALKPTRGRLRPSGDTGRKAGAVPGDGLGRRAVSISACSSAPEAEPARRYLAERQHFGREHRAVPSGLRARSLGLADQAGAATPKSRRRLLEAVGLIVRKQMAAGITTASAAACCFRFATCKAGRWHWAGECFRSRRRSIGGRQPTSRAKYVNSPETPLFSKSSLLYGLDSARDRDRPHATWQW